MKNRPLRTRLTLWTVVVGGVAVTLFGAIVGFSMQFVMLRQFDVTLRGEAQSLMEVVEQSPRPVRSLNQRQLGRLLTSAVSLYSCEIEQPPGTSVYRSRNLGESVLPSGPDDTAYTASMGNIGTARIFQITRDGARVRVAVDLSPFEHWERKVWQAYAVLVPTTLVLLGFGAHWLYRRALKPVDDIAAAADRITAGNFDRRLPESGFRDEIGNLTTVLNRMIERLQRSFEQARRFSADASHELKTPLTILRGELENLLRNGNLSAEAEESVLDLLEQTGRLGHIVEGLLLLSQADCGRLRMGREIVNLSALLEEIVEDVVILAERRQVTVSFEAAPGVQVHGDAHFLRQMILNLFDNAIKYNHAGGKIRCELTTTKGEAVLRVANTGEQIPLEQRERVFDRFHRVEPSRARETPIGGQGLGLSICREIARSHNGALTVEPSASGWNVFQLAVPLAHPVLPESGSALPAGALASAERSTNLVSNLP